MVAPNLLEIKKFFVGVVLAAAWWLVLHREALERAAPWRDERRQRESESVLRVWREEHR